MKERNDKIQTGSTIRSIN